jgi:hypothetical protein
MDRLKLFRSSTRAITPARRISLVATGILVGGLISMGCGSSQAVSAHRTSTSTTTNSTTSSNVTPDYAWLSSKAEPWNHKLNHDQGVIDVASSQTGKVTSNVFFARLAAACHQMLDDAGKAQTISNAPSSELDGAWRGMVAQTKAYASNCLTLARTRAASDLTTWNNSLTTMNTANGTFNTAVAAVRNGQPGTAG